MQAAFPPERRPYRVVAELQAAKLIRAVYSERQLEEVMVDFWFNHFNVYSHKGPTVWMVTSYERDAIRPHALGRFRDLLGRDGPPSGDAVLPRQLAQHAGGFRALRRGRTRAGGSGSTRTTRAS